MALNIKTLFTVLCFLAVGLMPTPITANLVHFNQLISDVRFVGLRNLDLSFIPTPDLKLSPGTVLTEDNLTEDINTLYLTGHFHQVIAQTAPSGNQVTLVFQFEENPVVSAIVMQGNTQFSDRKLQKLISNQPGKVANIRNIEQDKDRIESYYRDRGYDLAQVLSMSLNDRNELEVVVSEGTIEVIEFTGLKKIQKFVLARTLFTKAGDVFNSRKLRRDRERLLRLGYFSEISPPLLAESLDKTKVAVVFEVREKKVNMINIGLEQERDKFVGFLSANHNHLTLHSDFISGKVQVGADKTTRFDFRSYSVTYFQPWLLNLIPVSLTVDIWNEINREFLIRADRTKSLLENTRIGGSVLLGFPIWPDYLTFFTKYKSESVRPRSPGDFTFYKLRSFSGALQFSTVRNIQNPKSGTYWIVGAEQGGRFLGVNLGGLDFSRYTFNSASFYALRRSTVIGVHVSSGLFIPSSQNIETFERETFEVGGANSLRGYKELNPSVGFRKVQINMEIRQDLSSSWQGVLFYDLGRTFNSGLDLDFGGYLKGYGFGIRFFTPVAPFRLDFAWGQAFIIHFGLGQVF